VRDFDWLGLGAPALSGDSYALWGLTDMGYDTIQIHLDALLKEQLSTYSHTNMVDESAVVSAALRQYLESDQPTLSELAAGYKEMATINRAIAADFAATEDHDERRIV
jgi:metal-responsive CopG/Arc/MetJ family transcriptional regulator